VANHHELSNFIWQIADLLRGPYRPPQYERVMLPMTVLRRFDCVLEPTKQAVLKRHARLKDSKVKNFDPILNDIAKDADGNSLGFHNHSDLDFQKLKGDPDHIGRHLSHYIDGFSENVREIFARFEFEKEIEKLEEANRLYLVVSNFADVDLDPRVVDNIAMGTVFEDLIRRFNEAANETAGDHFTPREVIRLMVNLLLEPDSRILTTKGVITTVCDIACGTGGMLAEAQNWIREHNPDARVLVYGQDYNPRSYAVAASDLLIKGHSDGKVEFGNSLTDDKFAQEGKKFDYLLANPPFGVDWKAEQQEISEWSDFNGYRGKLPRVNDGALMFLLAMIGKFQPVDFEHNKHGSRVAIVFNGSPMFTGGAGSGESEIRRWIIEHDWLEAIVALPEQMFYNTGILTYIWIVTNRKAKSRKDQIQLIDARERGTLLLKNLGDKRRYLTDKTIADLTREHGAFKPTSTCKILSNDDFGYRRITVDRPLRLRFQITDEAKEQFLDAYPAHLDAIAALEAELGPDPLDSWDTAWQEIKRITESAGAEWTTANKKLFRSLFTKVNPNANPVIVKRSNFFSAVSDADFPRQKLPDLKPIDLNVIFGVYPELSGKKPKTVTYEADPDLRDFENVPLKEDIVSFFLREVRPFVADAWIAPETKDEQDKGIGKVGFDINFNSEFFRYQAPRALKVIDEELDTVERRILELLKEVTE
jgi:type I restriction enzyme M protein